MGGGTEAFPDLGMHCQHHECRQLDFLPFNCDSCHKVFCSEHRSNKAHDCPKSDHKSRKVIVCETCSMSIDTTGQYGDDEKAMLEMHEKSGACDPKNKKKKPTCPVRRCKEILTFSNTSTCKTCQVKVCLRHRFPSDHTCRQSSSATRGAPERGLENKFLVAFGLRNAKGCAKEGHGDSTSPPSTPSVVKAC